MKHLPNKQKKRLYFSYIVVLFVLSSLSATAQIKITGVVTDENDSPMPGISIVVKNGNHGTTTNNNGEYSIDVPKDATLVFSFIGYKTLEQTVGTRSILNIRLSEEAQALDEVVVVGYGTQKKESIVSAVSTIQAKDLSFTKASLTNSISGRVSGVIAIQRSGEPGNDVSDFWIRGVSSYAGGTSPLILVDGVPRKMNDIGVDEIETFTVLKDAAATSVYGAEGANGVVLITSKRGKVQKTRMNFTAEYGISTPQRMPSLLNAYDYLDLYNEGKWNDLGNPMDFTPTYSEEVLDKHRDNTDPDLYPNVDWMTLLKKNTSNQRYTLNFRGGAERVQYFISGAYYTEDGIFDSNPIEQYDSNIGMKRYNLRSNVDMKLTSTTKMAIDMSGQYSTLNTPGTGTDAIFSALTLFPTHLVPMYYSDGSSSDHILAAYDRYNPYNLLNHSGYKKKWQASLQTKVSLEQELNFIAKGLMVRGILSFDADYSSTMKRTKSARTYYATGRDEDGTLIKKLISSGSALSNPTQDASSGTKSIYLETSINYKRIFAEVHDVNAMLLYMQKETQSQKDDNGLRLLPYRKQSYVARLSYGFDKRYILEGSLGVTGSENFASGHRFGFFPAVGVSWHVSNEQFMKSLENTISSLKIRASIGKTGNDKLPDNVGRFPYRESLNTGGGSYNLGFNPGVGGGGTNNPGSGIVEDAFGTPSLTWEIERKINFGVDLGMFRGRVNLIVDYFDNRRHNILITRRTIPTVSGFVKNPMQNFGITTNKGIDASLNLKQRIGQVNVSAMGNITFTKDEVVEYDEIFKPRAYQNYTGNPIGQPLLYIAERLYNPDDFEITINPSNGSNVYELKEGYAKPGAKVAPGDIKYKDLDGNGTIDSYDKTYDNSFHPVRPRIVYGFGLNLDWKGFAVGVFFQGVARSSLNMLAKAQNFVPFLNGVDNSSGRTEVIDHWNAFEPYNGDVLFPRIHADKFPHNLEASTWWYRDAGFIRLKNVEFSYQFNKKIINKIKIEDLRIYVQGNNIAQWDNLKFWDPELGGANSGAKYPLSRTWTIGLDIRF